MFQLARVSGRSLGCLLLIASLGLSACGDDRRVSNVSDTEIALREQAWTERRILDYTIVYRESCFCEGGEITVIVRDGKIDSTSREIGPGSGTFPVGNPLTVPGLFDLIRRAQQEADNLEVRFDADLDYPDRISIDWERNAIDDEYGLTVVRLTRQ